MIRHHTLPLRVMIPRGDIEEQHLSVDNILYISIDLFRHPISTFGKPTTMLLFRLAHWAMQPRSSLFLVSPRYPTFQDILRLDNLVEPAYRHDSVVYCSLHHQ